VADISIGHLANLRQSIALRTALSFNGTRLAQL
jgi:hypothetical protein